MPNARKNKVRFNLKNVHYAPLTGFTEGVPTYDTPIAIPGAVSLSRSERRTGKLLRRRRRVLRHKQ